MLLRPWIPAFAGMTGLSVVVQRFWARLLFRVEGTNAPQTLDTRLRGYDGAVVIESFSRGLNSYRA